MVRDTHLTMPGKLSDTGQNQEIAASKAEMNPTPALRRLGRQEWRDHTLRAIVWDASAFLKDLS
jgi:hypothetical protein